MPLVCPNFLLLCPITNWSCPPTLKLRWTSGRKIGSCGRAARQSSAKAPTPVRIWTGPLETPKQSFRGFLFITDLDRMRWRKLTSIRELDEALALSEDSTVLILKHSTRCGVSRFALRELESKWKEDDEKKLAPYFLDLLAHRDVSAEIETRLGVRHESPQVLLIRNRKNIYSATHSDIDYFEILAHS